MKKYVTPIKLGWLACAMLTQLCAASSATRPAWVDEMPPPRAQDRVQYEIVVPRTTTRGYWHITEIREDKPGAPVRFQAGDRSWTVDRQPYALITRQMRWVPERTTITIATRPRKFR